MNSVRVLMRWTPLTGLTLMLELFWKIYAVTLGTSAPNG